MFMAYTIWDYKFTYRVANQGSIMGQREYICRVELPIPNHDPIGNLEGAIISIRLRLILVISFCGWLK